MQILETLMHMLSRKQTRNKNKAVFVLQVCIDKLESHAFQLSLLYISYPTPTKNKNWCDTKSNMNTMEYNQINTQTKFKFQNWSMQGSTMLFGIFEII
jgi:hypothetical protein